MVIRYRFPYSRQREAALLGTYGLTPSGRVPYYQTLSAMVEHNFLFTEYLKQEGVPSILTFDNTYQKQEESGIIGIYGVANTPVTPITQAIFNTDFNALTALNVFLRLAHTLRDIHNTPVSPAIKCLDMDDVYLTNENKILLGGFFYVDAEGLPQPTSFLPDAPIVMPQSKPADGTRNQADDIKNLARIAWNIFSGLPWDCCQLPASLRVPPKYAPPQLREVLELGMTDPTSTTTFHKQLMQCRKELSKTEFANLIIPSSEPMRKQYHFRTDRNTTAPTPQTSSESS